METISQDEARVADAHKRTQRHPVRTEGVHAGAEL